MLRPLGKHSFRIVLSLTAFLFILATQPCMASQNADFWMLTPDEWHENTDNLTDDLKKQVVAPDRNAFIEVYAATGNNPGVQTIADAMEEGIRSRGGVYFQNRLQSRDVMLGAHPAIVRQYSGMHNGKQLSAYAIYTYANGGAVVAIGVYNQALANTYRDTIHQCINSLRFTPPPTAQTAQPAGNSPACSARKISGDMGVASHKAFGRVAPNRPDLDGIWEFNTTREAQLTFTVSNRNTSAPYRVEIHDQQGNTIRREVTGSTYVTLTPGVYNIGVHSQSRESDWMCKWQ